MSSESIELEFSRRSENTVLTSKVFTWPYVLTRTFPTDDRGRQLSVIIQTGSGAINGADRLSQRFKLAPNTSVRVTTQGATSIYKAGSKACAHESVRLSIGEGANLEYLPDARIMFPDSAFSQSLHVVCAKDASALVLDSFTWFDPALKERRFREMSTSFSVELTDGRTVFSERNSVSTPFPYAMTNFRAFGSANLIFHSSLPLRELVAQITKDLDGLPGCYGSASILDRKSVV